MAGNLAPLIPALFTGPNGERLTADQIKRRQDLANNALLMATDTSPNAGGVASILAKGLAGFRAGWEDNKANRAIATNAEATKKNMTSLLGSILGGSPASSTAMPAAASTGVGAEMAATSPGATTPSTADAQQIRQGLINRGLPEHVADGFLVNFQDESGLNPGINEANPTVPGSRGGFGLYQLTGPRRVAYESFAQERGVYPSDVDAQLDFLMTELQGPEKAAADRIMAAGDTPMAAQAIVNHFLRPAPEHRERRMAAYANLANGSPAVMTDAAPAGYQDPMVVAPNSSPVASALVGQPAAAPAQPQMAQATAPTLPPINPAVIETLTSPYASADEKAVAQGLLGQYQSQQQAAEKRALAEQQRAAEIARRQQIAQQAGIDPNYASDDDIWKAAAGNIFAPPSTSTVDGAVIDNRTGQPIYQAPANPQTYTGYANYEQSQGRVPLGPLEYEQALRRSGASQTNVDTGTIPTGMRAVRDEQGRVVQYEPIPGGPAAVDAATLARTTERQAGARETASRVVTDAATRALEAMQAPGLPATGVAGGAMSWLPESNAAELRRQVDVLKSNATVENLNAMRAASPTGGALGSVTEKEGAMLAAKSGTLDPNSPNFARDVKDYTRTLLEVTHGPKVGKEIFDKMRWPGQAEEAEDAPPPDVDPEDWKFMSPEDRALFK